MSSYNILATLFDRRPAAIRKIVDRMGASSTIFRAAEQLDSLKEKISRIANSADIKEVRFWELLKRGYKKPQLRKIDHFLFYSNKTINGVEFDYCCHPKVGDEIVALYKENKAIIHHKLCMKAYEKIEQGAPMLFVDWNQNKIARYRLIISLQNQRGALAELLARISKMGLNVNSIELGIKSSESAEFCKLEVESESKNRQEIREELASKFKIVDIIALDDAYNN